MLNKSNKRPSALIKLRQKSVRQILAAAIILAIVQLVCRGIILKADIVPLSVLSAMLVVLQATLSDWAVTLGLALVFILGAQYSSWHRALARSFILLTLLLASLGIANITAVRMLGGPVTAQWLAFSDVANSSYMIDIIFSVLKPVWVFGGLIGVAAYIGMILALAPQLHGRMLQVSALFLILITFAVLPLGEPVFAGKESNPAIAMFASVFDAQTLPPTLFGTNDGLGADVHPAQSFTETLPAVPRPDTSNGQVKNVILFVMESVGAHSVAGYDQPFDVTPVIASLAPSSLRISDAYAHVPTSSYSLVSILAGIVPELSPNSMTYNRPDAEFHALPAVLAARGYKTGFFSSPDVRFQNNGGFATHAGFEVVQDSRNFNCLTGVGDDKGSTQKFLDIGDDHCLIPPVLTFIDKDPERPFLAMLWTGMTHYPYYSGDSPQHYVEDTDKNKYLNAIREDDAIFGQLVQGLRDRGLLDSTLIVIVGDHGEAFGEHGTYGHVTEVYEEYLRIPMIFINPKLFSGEKVDRIVGMSAVAPTIADLLGIPAPDTWKGQSLFAANRANGLMFFTAWNGLQIGYREGETKFVLNANTGETRLTNLAADPQEQVDLSKSDPDQLAISKAKLASWVRLHDSEIQTLLAPLPTPLTVAKVPSQITVHLSGTEFKDPPQVAVRLDGANIGILTVTNAVSNAQAAVNWPDAIAQGQDFILPADIGACPKLLEFDFLNDAWAGEGQTGDTNVFFGSVTVGTKVYDPWQFQLVNPEAGNEDGNVFYMWRSGTLQIPLEPSANCIVGNLTGLK